MATHPAYQRYVWPAPYPASWSKLGTHGFKTYLTAEFELQWHAHALAWHAKDIEQFLILKARFDSYILIGSTDEARKVLDYISEKFGVSLWLAESEIALRQVSTGLQSQRDYVRLVLSEQSSQPLIRYLIYWVSLKFEENMTFSQLSKLVGLHHPGGDIITSLLRVTFGEIVSLSGDEVAGILSYIDTFPVIDRYLSFIKISQLYAATCDDCTTDKFHIKTALSILTDAITDPRLHRSLLVVGGNGSVPCMDKNFISGLDAYTLGEYVESSIALRNAISDNPSNLAALEVYVKAQIRQSDEYKPIYEGSSLIGQIEKSFHEMYTYGILAVEARRRLQRIALVYASLDWAPALQITTAIPSLLDAKSSRQVSTSLALRVRYDSPALLHLLPNLVSPARYLSNITPNDVSSITVDLYASIYDNSATIENFLENSLIPLSRQRRYLAMAYQQRGQIPAAIDVLLTVYNNGDTQSKLEAGYTLACLLLAAGRFGESADIAAEIYLEAPYFATVLPLNNLVEKIVFAQEEGDPRGARGSISIAIVTDMYTRYVGSDQESARSDAYKDFIKSQGVKRASELASRSGEYDRRKLVYFLRYVCVPEVTDQSLALASTLEVENERVAVLLLLSELTPEADRDIQLSYLEELRAIRTRQVIRDTNTRLDQSKIFVNVEGIRKSIDVTMRDNWNRYRILTNQNSESNFLAEIERLLGEQMGQRSIKLPLSGSATEHGTLFQQMIREIRSLFVESKEFGLDANLSANIRHGYILRELRSPLLAANLITNRPAESSPHEPNLYWPNKIQLLSDRSKSELQKALHEFATDIDNKIDALNDQYLRIQSSSNPKGMFSYPSAEIQFRSLKQRCEGVDSYDEFIDLVMNYFWSATDYNLVKVRRFLERPVLQGFLDALETLERSLDKVASVHRLVPLRTAINLVRPEIQAAIERVSNWFTLSKEIEYPDYSIETAFQAGLQTIKSYAVHNTFDVQFVQANEIMLRGWTLPFLGRIIFILLDNIVEHSKIPQGEIFIRAEVKLEGSALSINVSNKIGDLADLNDIFKRISEVNAEYGSEKATQYISVERRSGYPKVWKILTHDLRLEHILEVNIDSESRIFSVQIYMSSNGIVS